MTPLAIVVEALLESVVTKNKRGFTVCLGMIRDRQSAFLQRPLAQVGTERDGGVYNMR